jgi:hypothetical protein
MAPGIDAAGLDRLRDAEAALRLGHPGAREQVIEAAVALMLGGVELPEVATIAGDERADDQELKQDLDRALTALGVDSLTVEDAAIRLATAIARDVVAGRGDLRSAARSVWDLWLDSGEPERLADFAITSDGFVDVPDYVHESDLREVAAAFLAQAPTG